MMQGVKSQELAERAAQLAAQGVNPKQVLRQALDRQAGGYVTMSSTRRSRRGVACGQPSRDATYARSQFSHHLRYAMDELQAIADEYEAETNGPQILAKCRSAITVLERLRSDILTATK